MTNFCPKSSRKEKLFTPRKKVRPKLKKRKPQLPLPLNPLLNQKRRKLLPKASQ